MKKKLTWMFFQDLKTVCLNPTSVSKKSQALSLPVMSTALLLIMFCSDGGKMCWEKKFQALVEDHNYDPIDLVIPCM